MSKVKEEENLIITTEKINEIHEKERLGLKLKRHEGLWHDKNIGVRRSGVIFEMTPEEVEEYTKCKLSIFYFANNYCKVKREDGKVGLIELRDYQRDILRLYHDNRYSILMASRQVGKCVSFNTIVSILKGDLIEEFTIGELYYNELKKIRPLNIYEKSKLFLYRLLKYLE